jgi:hypothetical protein
MSWAIHWLLRSYLADDPPSLCFTDHDTPDCRMCSSTWPRFPDIADRPLQSHRGLEHEQADGVLTQFGKCFLHAIEVIALSTRCPRDFASLKQHGIRGTTRESTICYNVSSTRDAPRAVRSWITSLHLRTPGLQRQPPGEPTVDPSTSQVRLAFAASGNIATWPILSTFCNHSKSLMHQGTAHSEAV